MILKVSSNPDDSMILATHPCSAHSHWLWGAAEVLVSLSGSLRNGGKEENESCLVSAVHTWDNIVFCCFLSA